MHFGWGGYGMIIFWIVLAVVIFVLIKLFTDSTRNRDSPTKTPMETLKERYAAGELTREEFEEKKRDLTES